MLYSNNMYILPSLYYMNVYINHIYRPHSILFYILLGNSVVVVCCMKLHAKDTPT